MIFLVVYYALLGLLLLFVVGMLELRRNHKVIVPRDVVTLIPFHILSYAQCVVIAVSIIEGKPEWCSSLVYSLVAIAVSPDFISFSSGCLSHPPLSLSSIEVNYNGQACDFDYVLILERKKKN